MHELSKELIKRGREVEVLCIPGTRIFQDFVITDINTILVSILKNFKSDFELIPMRVYILLRLSLKAYKFAYMSRSMATPFLSLGRQLERLE